MSERSYWLFAAGLVLAALAFAAVLYPQLPATIPTHWNARGQVDGRGAKQWAAFALPALMAGMMGFFALLPWLSPRKFEVDGSRATYLFVMVLTVGLFGYIHALSLLAGLRGGMEVGRALVAGMMLFFAAMGNVMGKLRRNFYIGIRVPWTLASDRVWNDTHRLAAWLWVACGLVGFALALSGLPLYVSLAPTAVAALVPVGYAFLLSKRLERTETPAG
jgi:uncharacterized membrane protein